MQPAPDAFATQHRKNKPVILCVDDVKEVLDTLEEQLNAYLGKSFAFETALSGEEGLEVIEDLLRKGREVAVIIADVIMPGMKGDEFLIRAHKLTPKTLNIMLTGEAGTMNHVTNAINNARLYRFIQKPWDIKDMQITIGEAGKSYLQNVTIDEQNRTLKTLHEASQVIARQLDLHDIYRALMRLILDYSGAEKAILAVSQTNELKLQAMARPNLDTEILDGEALSTLEAECSGSIIQHVAKAGTEVVLGNAVTEGEFASDPYVQKNQVKSVLCAPLKNMNKMVGVLYLEHRGSTYHFSPDRVEAINVLMAQAAIAIDNAKLYEHLEDEVSRQTKQLRVVNSHKDEIIRIVSHEIRGPLGGISSLSALLRDPELARNSTEVIRYGELIQSSANNVLKLANSILDLAKMESGSILLKKAPLELSIFLSNLIPGFHPLTVTKNITLTLFAPDKVMVNADESQLTIAMSNLLSNAIKFTPAGGKVTITLRSTTHNAKPFAEIQVSDTGIGIPPEMQARIFDKFGVRQRTGTAGEKGTGLGLSIVSEIVNMHQGQIQVQSEVGKGTTFTLLMPQ